MNEPQQSNPDYEPQRLAPVTTINNSINESLDNIHLSSLSVETRKSPALWTPFYLRRTTLSGFVAVKFGFLFAIIALALIDVTFNGIATANSSQHYLWTYGPTAVFSIVAALWGQVEHRTKQAMPWKVLQQGPTPASKTLLLDYITPSLPKALISSIRSSHWPVAAAISNSLLIKLITVASTGLLVLQRTPIVRQNCNLRSSNDFVSSFNSSAIGSGPVISTFAILNGTIPYPPGTSRDLAFQHIEAAQPPSGAVGVEVEGLVHVLRPELDCETATVMSVSTKVRKFGFWHPVIKVDSPTCQVQPIEYIISCIGRDPGYNECSWQDSRFVSCNYTRDGHDSNRLLTIMAHASQETITGSQPSNFPILSHKTSAILCAPKYEITSNIARMDVFGNLIEVSRFYEPRSVSQPFPAWDLMDSLQTSALASFRMTEDQLSDTMWEKSYLWMLFRSWVDRAHLADNLTSVEELKSLTKEFFSMVTSQLVKESLMVPSTSDIVGTCYWTEERLRVKGLSLYLMSVTLILSAALAIFLVYKAPRSFTSRDPNSIGSVALILSSSSTLLSRLHNDGASDLKIIQNHLDGLECQSLFLTKDQYQFLVELTRKERARNTRHIQKPSTASSSTTFWSPPSLRPIFKISVIAFFLILVVVLEIVYSLSQKNNGVTNVDPQGYVHFSWLYIPTTVMLIAQLLTRMITFSSLLTFPYFLQRSSNSSTRNDLLQDYISQTAFQSVWKSVANRHYPVFLMTLTVLLSPLLTIAVSGLYTAQPVDVKSDVTLLTLNQLNTSMMMDNSSNTWAFPREMLAQVSTNIGLLLTQGSMYPPSTYDELVFPGTRLELDTSSDNSSDIQAGNIVTARLPALRADLSCNCGPEQFMNVSDTISNVWSTFSKPFVDAHSRNSRRTLIHPGSTAFGWFSSDSGAYGTSEMNWRPFECVSTVSQLDVDVTMDAASLLILKAEPNEGTLRVVQNNATYSIWYSFFDAIPTLFHSNNGFEIMDSKKYSSYDATFQAIIYSSGITDDQNNFPITEFMDDDGFRRLEAHLRHIYRIAFAQYANIFFRVPYDGSAPHAPPATITGILTTSNTYRLQQNPISTRILDGLLISIAICIAISFKLMDTRRVLPKNPASIAAAASLIAGEPDMLKPENLPKDAQWYTDDELEEKSVWGGCIFRLGWWDLEDSTGRPMRFGLDMGRVKS